jgi:hypothetical protein
VPSVICTLGGQALPYGRFCRNAARRAASLPAGLALHGLNASPVAAHLARRHATAVSRYAGAGDLSSIEAGVVAGLERDGVFVTSLADLGLSSAQSDVDIMACGNEVAGILAKRVAGMGDRRPTMIATGPDDLLRHPTIYRWGLETTLLRIVETYLRLPVAFDGPLVFHTPSDGLEAGTRRWHLDREDRRVVKLALYLHDVDEASGPFQILRHETHNDGRFRYPAHDTESLGRQLGRPVGPDDLTTCTGPAGTLVFADTARFYHRGKPATGRARSAIFYGYFARIPRHPFFCERPGLASPQIRQLVEGLGQEQRNSALWRSELPLLARLVPPSPT